jgi:anthranilate synthase component 2
MDVIRTLAPTKSILGVCLGHEAIGELYGGTLTNLDEVYHGVATPIYVSDASEKLFDGMDATFDGGRYHSWVVSREGFPACLKITALDDQGQIMALAHREYDLKGVQFHPESVLTPQGGQLLKNWLVN